MKAIKPNNFTIKSVTGLSTNIDQTFIANVDTTYMGVGTYKNTT